MFPKKVTEKGEAGTAASVNRRGTSGCGVLNVRHDHRGRKMSQFAGGRRDDEVVADDDAT